MSEAWKTWNVINPFILFPFPHNLTFVLYNVIQLKVRYFLVGHLVKSRRIKIYETIWHTRSRKVANAW